MGARYWAAVGTLVLAAVASGCQMQMAEPQAARRLVEHQSRIETSGLNAAESFAVLKVTCASPAHWRALPLQRNALYTHQQFKSPDGSTGVGVAYMRLPLPLSARVLAYFAKNEYAKREANGQILAEWSDRYGRYWFDGQNAKYHVTGYAITNGFDAWIVYSGYKLTMPPNPVALDLAYKCMETILPHGVERAAEMARERPEPPGATARVE